MLDNYFFLLELVVYKLNNQKGKIMSFIGNKILDAKRNKQLRKVTKLEAMGQEYKKDEAVTKAVKKLHKIYDQQRKYEELQTKIEETLEQFNPFSYEHISSTKRHEKKNIKKVKTGDVEYEYLKTTTKNAASVELKSIEALIGLVPVLIAHIRDNILDNKEYKKEEELVENASKIIESATDIIEVKPSLDTAISDTVNPISSLSPSPSVHKLKSENNQIAYLVRYFSYEDVEKKYVKEHFSILVPKGEKFEVITDIQSDKGIKKLTNARNTKIKELDKQKSLKLIATQQTQRS